jgi:diacylglycerol kinase (ATP)
MVEYCVAILKGPHGCITPILHDSKSPISPLLQFPNAMALSELAFVVNPNAGGGSTGEKWPKIAALAREGLGPFDAYVTARTGDAAAFAKEAIMEGASTIVCVGGDGTLNEVVNGLMAVEGQRRTGTALGYIPNGTGCDFIKSVPIPRDPEEALERIRQRNLRIIDLGKLVFLNHDGRSAVRYFHNVTSFGLGGEVDARVNRTSKRFGPFLSFIWATLISILVYGKKQVHLTVDDTYEGTVSVWNVAVANGQYHGGGMWVAPEAAVDDGMFDVTVVGDLSLAGVFRNLHNLYNGKIFQVQKVFGLKGKRITASSNQTVLLDVDGEQPGMLPLTVEVVPAALNMIA